MKKKTSINPDCKHCGGDGYLQDADAHKISVYPCEACYPECYKTKNKIVYNKEYRTSMQKAADAEDPNWDNIDWSDFGPNKEEWEE